uniref:Uncharacterized protein n=1 Tax=Cacopsylla melanoneura TaxID=428564 RepID=A0A8D8T415_9HEMI
MHIILQCSILLLGLKTCLTQHTGDFVEPPPTRWGRQRVTRMDWTYPEDMYHTELREEYDAAQFEIIAHHNKIRASRPVRRTITCFEPSPGLYSDSKEPLRRIITKKSYVEPMIGDFEDLEEEPKRPDVLGNLYRIHGVKGNPLPKLPLENVKLNLKFKNVKRRPLPTDLPPQNNSLNVAVENVKRRPLPTDLPPQNNSLNLEILGVKRRPLPTDLPPQNNSLHIAIENVKRRPLPTDLPPQNNSLNLDIEMVKRRPLPTDLPPQNNSLY